MVSRLRALVGPLSLNRCSALRRSLKNFAYRGVVPLKVIGDGFLTVAAAAIRGHDGLVAGFNQVDGGDYSSGSTHKKQSTIDVVKYPPFRYRAR